MTEQTASASVKSLGCAARADGVDLPPIPAGYVGPVVLAGTGHQIWWTGRVAIGLRYQRPPGRAEMTQSERWIQRMMLATRPARAPRG